ncbi:hypothetical protein F2Q69_00046240 [Brassica cretica]|uniref:Uncharacterized protein n=1 Tax=Brassica cretica TaxID=69181 RepID=A0A8S9PQH6_BRACR|nr:hypothetical protein F2Q69_00046240 [Brassica cretica]
MENLSLTKEKERLEAELSLLRLELQREAELAKESATRGGRVESQERQTLCREAMHMLRNSRLKQQCIRRLGVSSVGSLVITRGSATSTSIGLSKCGNNTSYGESGKLTKYG